MKNSSSFIAEINTKCPKTKVLLDEPMSKHTSFKIGGPVSIMLLPRSQREIENLFEIFAKFDIKPLVIGNGTNLLVDDKTLDIAVVKTCDGLGEIEMVGETELRAECGVLLSKLASFALAHSLTGLEFAHGIPGSLGGAVAMNAGAYGGEMKNVVKMTSAYVKGSGVRQFIGESNDFSYRHSIFSYSGNIVLSANITLSRGDPAEISDKMKELSEKRRASQPLNLPSAGSTFKRPQSGYAAALIEEAGLKGFGFGGAQVSDKHSGFIVNNGGATFEDVLRTMEYVSEEVFKRFGVRLLPEVNIIKA